MRYLIGFYSTNIAPNGGYFKAAYLITRMRNTIPNIQKPNVILSSTTATSILFFPYQKMNFSDPFRRILEPGKSQLCSPAERCAASCVPPRLPLVRGPQVRQLDPELGQLAFGAANNKHSPERSISAASLEKRNFQIGRNERLPHILFRRFCIERGPNF